MRYLLRLIRVTSDVYQAHGAPRLSPVEARSDKDLMQTFLLRLRLHQTFPQFTTIRQTNSNNPVKILRLT